MPVVTTRNLRKNFKVATDRHGLMGAIRGLFSNEGRLVRAVDGITFDIQHGEFVGYLGPNGAGKSTTIKMLSGILHPTDGDVRVLGISPQTDRKKLAAQIGVVFGQRTQLWWDLPVRDSFELLAAMYGVDPASYTQAMRQFDDMLEIGAFLDMPVRKLSLGQRMRSDLVAAWLHRPQVVFLDEPTIGLDAVAKARIRTFLQEINRQDGTTILLTTHDMDDIEQLCDRVIVINHGRLAYDGALEDLRKTVNVPTTISIEYKSVPPQFPAGPWTVSTVDAQTIEVQFDRNLCGAGEVISAFSNLGHIRDLHIAEPQIEQIIAQIYGHEIDVS